MGDSAEVDSASELEHYPDLHAVDVQDRDAEIAALRAQLAQAEARNGQLLRDREHLDGKVARLEAEQDRLLAEPAAAQAHARDVERDRDERLAAAVRGELHGRELLAQALERHVSLERKHEQAMGWSEALHDDIETRLRGDRERLEAKLSRAAETIATLVAERDGLADRLASADRRANVLADAADLLAIERDEAWAVADRRWQDRADALNVRSSDGLLSSEWLLRTGRAERERDAARADRDHWRIVAETQTDLTAAVLEDVATFRECAEDAIRALLLKMWRPAEPGSTERS